MTFRFSNDNQDDEITDEEEMPLALRMSAFRENNIIEESVEKVDKQPKKKTRKIKIDPDRVCGAVFFRRIGPRKYACTECDDKFIRKEDVRIHFRKVHTGISFLKCEICDKEFKKYSYFRLHRTLHGIDKNAPLYCHKCDYKTLQVSTLRNHSIKNHFEGGDFICDHCGKKFKLKQDIRRHMLYHEDTMHMCEECGKFFTTRAVLHNHQRKKHMNIYNFKCPFCKFRSISQDNLDKHIRDLHDDNNPHECKVCGKQFKIRYKVNEHMKRKHQGDKLRHACSLCNKSFFDSNKYMLHYLTHSKVRPYECNVCRETFTQRATLMSHWKKKHPDATERPRNFPLADFFRAFQEKTSGLRMIDQSISQNVTSDQSNA